MRLPGLIFLVGVLFMMNTAEVFSQEPSLSFSDSTFVLDLFKPLSWEELLNHYRQAKTDSEKLNSALKLAASRYADSYQIKQYLEEAYTLSTQLNARREQGICYMLSIYLESSWKGIDSCSQKAAKIFEEEKAASLFYLNKLYVASNFYKYVNYVEAFRLAEDFINHYQVKGDTYSFSRANNTIGEIYRNLHNYNEAIHYYKLAGKNCYANGTLFYPSPLINLGTVYKEIGKYDSAIFYFDKVLREYYKERVSTHAYIINRKAQIYMLQKDYSSALALASESLKLYQSIQYAEGLILAWSSITHIYYNSQQYAKCTQSGEEVLGIASKYDYFPSEILDALHITSEAYFKLNNIQKAYEFEKLYSEKYQQVFGLRTNLDLFNEQLKLDRQNQALERTLLLEKQKQTEGEVAYQRRFNIVFAAALIISVLGSIVLYRKNQTIGKLNHNLLEKQNEILAQSEELKATNEEIEAINSNLENLIALRNQKVIDQNVKLTEYAYFNAHKVRGPLARILGLINVFEKELAQHTLHEYSAMLKQAGQELDKSINEINRILEKETPESN